MEGREEGERKGRREALLLCNGLITKSLTQIYGFQ